MIFDDLSGNGADCGALGWVFWSKPHNFSSPAAGEKQFVFMPWGADGTLLQILIWAWVSIISHRVLENDALRDQLDARIRSLFSEIWDEAALRSELDRMVALLDQHIDMSARSEALEGVEAYIEAREEGLVSSLPGKPAELNTIGCIEEKGTIDATFETTWGTMKDGVDLFQTGSVDLTVVWEGNVIPFQATGVTAGVGEDEPT